MLNKLIYVLLLFAPFSTTLAQPNWMSVNSTILGKKRLNEIAIPGAHDAGTFPISASKGGRFKLGGGGGVTSPDNRRLKRVLSFGYSFSAWAKTQERTTSEMLADGIRYFDIRVCVDDKGVLMTCHGLYGASVASILSDVKKFIDRHPKELILLGFNHFWDRKYQMQQNKGQGEIEGLREDKWIELVDLVKSKLRNDLISSKRFSPKSELNELWKLKNNNRVIALFDTDDVTDDEMIWKRREENTWVEGWDIDAYKEGTLKVLQNALNEQYADKFYAVRSSVTPDENGKLISLGFIYSHYPDSVSELADMTNPVVLGWIKDEWHGKYPINLIWSDFYNRTDLIKLAKHINGIKVDFTETKIGTETNWLKWKKSKEDKN